MVDSHRGKVVPLADPAFWQDPYPTLSRIRTEHRTGVTDAGLKAILRFDDAEAVLKDGNFENEGLEYIEERGFRPGDALYEWRRHSIGARNGADHARIRGLVNRAMTHRSVDGLRHDIRRHARELIAAHAADGTMEVRRDFALRLPFLAITGFLGIEIDEAMHLAQTMSSGAGDAFGPKVTPEIRVKANRTFAAVMEFVARLADERRKQPRDDLLTHLIEAEEAGDRLTNDELIVLFTNIFSGAIESTASVLTSGVLELARHPEQAALLRSDPERWKRAAAEEVLRFRPAFYAIGKKAVRAHDAFGLHFEQGEPITILIGGPNRDAARWSDPERFDITRDPRVWSLTFSMGDHFCLGQALARCELQEAFAALVEGCEQIELEADPPQWLPHVMVNRVQTLPVRFRPTGAARARDASRGPRA